MEKISAEILIYKFNVVNEIINKVENVFDEYMTMKLIKLELPSVVRKEVLLEQQDYVVDIDAKPICAKDKHDKDILCLELFVCTILLGELVFVSMINVEE